MDTPDLPSWCHFLPQDYPSANVVLLTGSHPALVDSGYGSDADALFAQLAAAGTPPEALRLVVNTHWHSDHVGGNHRLQRDYGLPVAAARTDAEAVNARREHACLASWLDQAIEPYRVEHVLDPGVLLRAGDAEWQVLATPGHTPTHLSLFQPDTGVLIAGDAFHDDDVGWINLALDGPRALDDALRTVETLASLPIRCALSGHGPAVTDPAAALARARGRYERLRADPTRAAWHGMKRVFAYALMIYDGIPLDQVEAYLLRCGWLVDHATKVLNADPTALARDLLAEMRRIGATTERDGRLYPTTAYRRPAPGWRRRPGFPAEWGG
jgi:glyoxylase-like metal-dependent hydrolase (beta-lactamase superfamily II)